MVNIRSLLPVLKEKKRYILYECDASNKINNIQIEQELRGFIGDLGLAKANLKFIKSNNNRGILQVNHHFVHEIKAGLALINQINNNQIRMRTIKVSGVINKLKRTM